MPTIAKSVGAALVFGGVLLSVISNFTAGDGDSWSPTSLIPAFFGLIFFVIGSVGEAKPDLTKHLMHAGAVVAVLGILGAFMPLFGGGIRTISGLLLIGGCGFFLVKAIQSFKAARLERERLAAI